MSKSLYKINLKELCSSIDLGCLKNEPTPIQGGLLNKMFKIETSKGIYAVKALNPQIMLRNTAMKNYIFSEQVANVAYKSGIPALPALIVDGKSIQEVDGQYYLVFPWFEGKPLAPGIINNNKCLVIGELLAKIHNLNFHFETSLSENDNSLCSINWNNYIDIARAQNAKWLNFIIENLPLLSDLEEKANQSHKKLFSNLVVSHRDLDQKNVLWDSLNSPMIIDWEAAGYINPSMELLDVASNWSGCESASPNEQAFKSVVKSYCKFGGRINDNLNDVINSSFINKLGWLEYNIKRSLRLECSDEDEQILGTEQVIGTINSIKNYNDLTPIIYNWIIEIEEELS